MCSERQPKLRSNSTTSAFATSSFPQTKTSCSPGTFAGSTITSWLIVFSAFTTRDSGKARWICSARLSVLQTKSVGGIPCEKSSGFETSTSVLPARFSAPAMPSASMDAVPAVQLKTSSPNAAASANVPRLAASPTDSTHSAAPSCLVGADSGIATGPVWEARLIEQRRHRLTA